MNTVSIGKIKPVFDPLHLVGQPVQSQAHLCHAFCICSLVPSKTGKPYLNSRQTTALLTQDFTHVAHVSADSTQMFKDKIVDIVSHGITLTRRSIQSTPNAGTRNQSGFRK
jgi:hypothetical protein